MANRVRPATLWIPSLPMMRSRCASRRLLLTGRASRLRTCPRRKRKPKKVKAAEEEAQAGEPKAAKGKRQKEVDS